MSANQYTVARCTVCNSVMHASVVHQGTFRIARSWCPACEPRDEGRLIRAAGDVMRAQRAKGIAKYRSTLEDQNSYTVGGMIDMTAEELADGSVYVQKVREMYMALLDEIEAAVHEPVNTHQQRLLEVANIIKRERGA